MDDLLNEFTTIDNKIVKLTTQLQQIQEQIYSNIDKIAKFDNSDTPEDALIYNEVIAKLVKQKYNINVKIAKLTKDKNDLTKHFSKIEFN